jgi:hypothetical protein
MFILGGLALVLVAGVVLAGVIPTGNRAGTTATDASASESATPTATATEEQSADVATDASSTDAVTTTDASPTPSASAAVEVTTCADGGDCALGDIGPGGGLVFLISGGKAYEMAPKTWSGGSEDPTKDWCNKMSSLTGTMGFAVGTGSANTGAKVAGCSYAAGNSAHAYTGGGLTDWFLPSKDELRAMCYYSHNLSASPDPTVGCFGSSVTTQDSPFAAGTYGFARDGYWSSSQYKDSADSAWIKFLSHGGMTVWPKLFTMRVRPVRAF